MQLSIRQKAVLAAKNWRAVLRLIFGRYKQPLFKQDLQSFWHDPYPEMQHLRQNAPVCLVPILEWHMISRREDVLAYIDRFDLLSNEFDDGAINIIGKHMMRKDDEEHLAERKTLIKAISPNTAKTVWIEKFQQMVGATLAELAPLGQANMLQDVGMRISGNALRIAIGLETLSYQDLDRISQGIIDCGASFGLDKQAAEKCQQLSEEIDLHIDKSIERYSHEPDHSFISVQVQGGLTPEQIRANVKLAVTGGQNEMRDALCGSVYALLKHPDQLQLVLSGKATWHQVFDEYVRWLSPIGAAPRRVRKAFEFSGVQFKKDDMLLFLISSANRDERVFESPDDFNILRPKETIISFGKGPHFCAGAHIARALVADVALPAIFAQLKNLRLNGEVPFGGWMFRGPLTMPVKWD